MGHKSLAITEKTYAKYLLSTIVEEMEKVNSMKNKVAIEMEILSKKEPEKKLRKVKIYKSFSIFCYRGGKAV